MTPRGHTICCKRSVFPGPRRQFCPLSAVFVLQTLETFRRGFDSFPTIKQAAAAAQPCASAPGVNSPPPPPSASMLKVGKTTVTRAYVVRQGSACARRAVPKERMSSETCPYRTLITSVATGHYNTMCRQISASSGGPHCPSGPSGAVEYKLFPTLRVILNNCTCFPFWGSLWGRPGFGFWKGYRLPIPRDKSVINNIFGELKLGMSWRNYHKHNQAHLSLYKQTTIA